MPKRRIRSASRTLAHRSARIETLEARQMLSTINWSNRGVITGASDDRFDDVFGALQNQARAVVDTAIDYWERTITSFGYGNGTDTYNITISMNATAIGAGPGGVGANAGFNATINNRPSAGSMGIGWRSGVGPTAASPNSSAGWYLDPAPTDSSEFQGAWFNAFVRGPSVGANLGGADLLTAVLHELGHAMGLGTSTQTMAAATDTGTPDTVSPATTPPSTLWAYTNNQSLWTEFDSGGASGTPANFNGPQHFAPLGTSAVVSGQTRSGAVALMNSGFTSRSIISDIEADCLRAAYNMTIAPPSQFGTTYGQLDADGTLRVDTTSLTGSNDVIDLRVVGANLQLTINPTVRVAGIDPLGVITSNFPLAGVQRININTGDGNDFVRVFSNGGRPVTVPDTAGNDTLEGHGAVNAYDNFVFTPSTLTASGLSVAHNGAFEALQLVPEGGTADFTLTNTGSTTSLQIFGSSAGETLNLRTLDLATPCMIFAAGGNDVINIQPDFGSDLVRSPVTVNGSDGDDVVHVGPVDNGGTLVTRAVTFNGGPGADTFNLGSNNADSVRATMTFNGEGNFGGLGDRIIVNDQAATYTVEYEVNPTFVRRVGFGTYNINYTQASEIVIHCGSAGDIVNRRPGVSPIVRANGNGGDDTFTESVVAPISSSAFNGGTGNNTIIFDGSNEAVGRTWQVQSDRGIYSGAINYLTTQFTSVIVLAGSGNDSFTFQPTLFSQAITADGGPGDDSFNTTGSRIPSLTLRGGTAGFDTLGVDDRTLLANLDSADLYPDRYVRYRDPQFPGDPGEYYNVFYSGFESINAWRRPAQVIVNVYGTSPDVLATHSTVLNGDTSDSVIHIHARDAGGNLTLASNLRLDAGGTTAADHVYIHAAGSQPGNYRFYNRFTNSTAQIDGLGAGYLTVDNLFDSLTFNAGSGADTFAFDSYRSGNAVAINGSGGDDTMNIVPTGKDLFAITSFASFSFNGGAGSDTMTMTNENSPSGYAYFVSNANLSTIRIAGGQPQLGFGCASTEVMNIRGSQLADQYQSFLSDNGQRFEFSGLNGNDAYVFGGLIGTTLQLFRGPIFIDGGGGQDNIQLRDEEITAARTFHIAADSVGAFAGDNLFGVGGSLRFANIAGTLSFNGGPGAETVYATPHPTAAITLNGNTPPPAPGDRLFLGLAGAQNASINGTAANGSVTSSNLRTLSYNGFETGPTVDAVAPTVVAAALNVNGAGGLAGGGPQSIDVGFSEDVSALLTPASLRLQNLTTGQTIPSANVAVAYVAATNTARFTFPGYANGVLPDGDYQGTVLAGLPDFFGNGLPSDVGFAFFFLNGDANRDRTVGIGDFAILAANFNRAGAFSNGDFNYSGIVEIGDFAIMASKFNTALPAPAGLMMRSPATRFSGIPVEERLINLV